MNISPGPAVPATAVSRQLIWTFPSVLQVQGATARIYVLDASVAIKTVEASVGTAPTGANVVFDVLKNGISVYTTVANRPTIPPGTFVITATLPDITALVKGDYLQVAIVQIGSSVAGSDATVQLLVG